MNAPAAWIVRRYEFSRVTPWEWRCTAKIALGPRTKPCGKWGLAKTKDAAEKAAAGHADTHTATR